MARILLLEDDPDLHALLEFVLRRAAHEPLGVATIAAARDRWHNEGCDLALLDAHLPDGDSAELARDLIEARIPVIVWTGEDRGELSARAARIPEATILRKPMDPLAVAAQVQARLLR